MKKSVLLVSLILSVIIVSSLVSAQWYGDLSGATNQLIQWIQNIFGPIFEILLGANQSAQYFFARILLLILLYVIILTVLRRMTLFREYPFVYILVSAIIAILATRYISELNIFEFILLPYGALGIALSVFLPFLIYGFFVHESVPGTIGRRAAWIVFAVVFFGLWITRRINVGQYGWIYWLGIIAVLISVFWDGTIHRYFELGKYRRGERGSVIDSYYVNEEKIRRLESAHPDRNTMPGNVRQRYQELLNARKALHKQIS